MFFSPRAIFVRSLCIYLILFRKCSVTFYCNEMAKRRHVFIELLGPETEEKLNWWKTKFVCSFRKMIRALSFSVREKCDNSFSIWLMQAATVSFMAFCDRDNQLTWLTRLPIKPVTVSNGLLWPYKILCRHHIRIVLRNLLSGFVLVWQVSKWREISCKGFFAIFFYLLDMPFLIIRGGQTTIWCAAPIDI